MNRNKYIITYDDNYDNNNSNNNKNDKRFFDNNGQSYD